MFFDPLTERLAAFGRDVAFEVPAAELPEPTFLPGLDIRDVALLHRGGMAVEPRQAAGRSVFAFPHMLR